MKYDEHIEGKHYGLAFEKEMSSRDEAYGGASFQERYDDPELRDLVRKAGIPDRASVLVIGTGTGADACWLADHGYRVTGIDFVPKAVAMATRIASARGCTVAYHCDDVCHAKGSYGLFDAIIDSYCLQNIVSDADRARDYDFVRSHLEADGRYLIISAGYAPEKGYNADYRRDDCTGIVLQLVKPDERHLEDICLVEGREFVPVRRHYTVEALCAELRMNGFDIVDAEGIPVDGALRVVARKGKG
jgi:cyclopropane fatty-acyl-phospholipid synthase-like methyltransferase